MSALLRSRDLVKGNCWPIAKRLILISFMFLGVFLVLGGLAGVITGFIGESKLSELLGALALQLISAGVTIMGLHIGMELYRSLVSARPELPIIQSSNDKWKYNLLAIAGVIFIIGVFILVLTLSNLSTVNQKGVDTELNKNLSNKERAVELRAAQQ